MDIKFLNAGERCITVCFGNEISIEMNTRVRMLKKELEDDPVEGIIETVPTYCALSVHFLPEVIRKKELERILAGRIIKMKPIPAEEESVKEVPVYYGGETGPDLEYCAQLEGISVDELIRKHSSHEYYVYQLGFSPGHPYMARKEEPFSFKRRETPRVDIPAHSVVVQTNLTNITPFHQPSGWNIIGSTPLNITDYSRDIPFFFSAGDRVRLKPVDKNEYDRIKKEWDNTAKEAEPCSSKPGFTVEQPGALTTIQDEGRLGYQASGVSPAGPMDHKAFHLANILAGNRMTVPGLEITLIGPTLRFSKETVIAITGADLTPRVNGEDVPMYTALRVSEGDVLSFGVRKNGCRAYIAFAGGIDEPKIMGSNATDLKNGLGGFKGRALKAGDMIALADAGMPEVRMTKLPPELLKEKYDEKEIVLRVVLGPQDDRFTKKGIKSFFNYSAAVTEKSDRQGIRLECKPLELVTDSNIISDGISLGAIQVANDGKPIILLADRQSVGGYAKIGNVIYEDLPKLGQALPGCRIRFVQVSPELAEELYIRHINMMKELEAEYVQNRS